MKKLCIGLLSLLMLVTIETTQARENPKSGAGKQVKPSRIELRSACAESTSSWDLNINNVRARLRGGGDLWWDGTDPKFIVPNVTAESGIPEVSSIFAGAVWLGGYDKAGNLKLAAQTYRDKGNDFWPGPLTNGGSTNDTICHKWDKFFNVYGSDISKHIGNFKRFVDPDGNNIYDDNDIPSSVKGWPSRGNPYFESINGFSLPDDDNGLAGFHDQDNDFVYNPKFGDYPVIEIRGCELENYPDQMVFWIYNDAGNAHSETKGDQINMEVQVQAFAYASNDELNDMTFYRFKLINRAIEPIDSTFFAMWVDPDLGCAFDDYVGCDTTRSLMYMYNQDAVDGSSGASCSGTNTYGTHIPMIGVDYFRGPNDENGKEIGMSSFVYYNNSIDDNDPCTEDPTIASEYYRYLSGSWRCGTTIKQGGSGYSIVGKPTKYTFPNSPNDANGWSMCSANLPKGDRRTIQASGPFRLDPGKKNELIIGTVWVPNIPHPCPDPSRIFNADDLAQALFDNCFKVTDGPDAPDIDFIELNKQLVLILTNDTLTSNNAFEAYTGVDLKAPKGTIDSLYRFEGYKIYQLANANVASSDFNDPEKAQIIAQVDIKNGVSKIFNWSSIEKPNTQTNENYWIPTLKSLNDDAGIKHTFSVTEDVFAKGDRTLINHKKYYFKAVAYAYNSYAQFDPATVLGQRTPYLEGRRIAKDAYIGIPRPIDDRNQNSQYGDAPTLTRLDGNGAGGFDLQVSDQMRTLMFEPDFNGEVTYLPGHGPIDIKVFNPIDNKSGEFILTFVDSDMSNDKLESGAKWIFTKTNDPNAPIISDYSIERLNEQIIPIYGFSITVAQTADAGDKANDKNGFIDARLSYSNSISSKWLSILPDLPFPQGHFIKTDEIGTQWFNLDPKQAFYNDLHVYPYRLCEYIDSTDGLISPAWQDPTNATAIQGMKLQDLNNVDIVFTKDTSKWSRCMIIESTDKTLATYYSTEGGAKQFDLRFHGSVSKKADQNGNPIPDAGNDKGMGWFPGYAVDVETGQRLNIFFGEASVYRLGAPYFDSASSIALKYSTADMMFNPTSPFKLDLIKPGDNIFEFLAGGQHTVYVTKQNYDGCAKMKALLESKNNIKRTQVIREITWTFIPMLTPGEKLLSYNEGLIPNDAVISMRVDNPFQVSTQKKSTTYKGYPTYKFKFEDQLATTPLNKVETVDALKEINVVPNPYYAYSEYETSQFTNIVKITNLPNKCNVTIYTLDGRFIRQYKRNEAPGSTADRSNPPYNTYQVIPDIEWDMKNDKGIPIGSGVYLIHVEVEGVGERTLKWFGVGRKFDPSGL
ncbi:MAG TPA: hypothetical protein VK590_02800 [Saprospiraceae bacterium]|nr:hypothetical protein [Saprospiraceae bacterium]